MAYISYFSFQNFFCHAITVKQFIAPDSGASREEMKKEKNWVTVLKNYKLMQDAHFENDAQKWHIVGFELVSALLFS